VPEFISQNQPLTAIANSALIPLLDTTRKLVTPAVWPIATASAYGLPSDAQSRPSDANSVPRDAAEPQTGQINGEFFKKALMASLDHELDVLNAFLHCNVAYTLQRD
jgi:hypothetical protein